MKRSPLRRKRPMKCTGFKRKPVSREHQKALNKAKNLRYKTNPYSPYWKNKATTLWSTIVRLKANGRCEYTGKRCDFAHMDAHHIVSRAVHEFRCDIGNGLAIKKHFHVFDKSAPHGSESIIFYEWLEKTHPDKHALWLDNRNTHRYRKWNWEMEYERLNAIFKEMFKEDTP